MTATRIIDKRLLGEWKSDASRTLEEWAHPLESSSEDRARVARLFGKLVIRYTPARVFTEYEGSQTACAYRVAAQDPHSVAIVRRTDGKDEIQHLRFEGENMYWVSVGRNREFFQRLVPV